MTTEWQLLAKVLWIMLLAAVLLLEGLSLGKGAGTMTENVVTLTAVWLGRAVVGGTLIWLFYHWIVDRSPGLSIWDALAVVVGAAAALLLGKHRDKR